jgi:formate dehydrogenase maturation protein FdhE
MTQISQTSEAVSPHLFGVKCANGHITYFDKRRVCPASGTLVRRVVRDGDTELDELYLKCETCDAEVVVRVDCEGYK